MRVYALPINGGSITAANGDYDLWYVAPADDKPVRFLGFFLGQTSELGDAAEELLGIQVIRGHTTVGSGGSAVTAKAPVNMSSGSNFGFTGRVMDSVVASAGTTTIEFSDTMNVRTGYKHFWTPETAPAASQAHTTMVVRMITTAADDITGVNGVLYVQELG